MRKEVKSYYETNFGSFSSIKAAAIEAKYSSETWLVDLPAYISFTEKYRGLDYTEDLFSHGKLSVTLRGGDSLGIVISTEDPQYKDAVELLLTEEKRKRDLLSGQQDNETIQQLVLAADQFIVNRGDNLKTIIAGYHWFTDWGRDTMISLPGLTLSTGRYEDAKKYCPLLPAVLVWPCYPTGSRTMVNRPNITMLTAPCGISLPHSNTWKKQMTSNLYCSTYFLR